MLATYLHEASHRLLEKYEVDMHGAAFFCLQYTLFERANSLPDDSIGHSLTPGFYDIQDPPNAIAHLPKHVWLPRAIAWAIKTASQDDGTCSAEKLAEKIVNEYRAWAVFLEKEPGLEWQRKQAAADRLERLENAVQKWKKRAAVAAMVAFGFMIF